MKFKFWLTRFLVAGMFAFVFIAGAQFFKTQHMMYALEQAAIWSPITALIYILVLAYKFRKHPNCAIREEDQKLR